MSTIVPEDAPKPRLSHVKKAEDFSGYGFNLHAEKGKAGQFIGKVDPGSPAEKAKLKEGDRIVEVNGTNIGNENHQQVVQRIKAVPDETKLLVVDSQTDNYYKEKKIVIRGDMPNVLCHSSVSTTDTTTVTTNGMVDARPASTTSSNNIPADAPQPRNCVLKVWPNFQGYGFNLHAEKGKPGQFIGHVDEGSPADCAGMKEGDRIIEVNGENIAKDNHGEVVKKIKSDPTQTTMLVLDPQAEKYYRERDITVKSTDANVLRLVCPDIKPEANGSASQVEAEVNHVSESEKEDKAEVVAEYANVIKEAPQPSEPDRDSGEVSVEHKVNGNSDGEEAAEAITESIREMEDAVADESIKHESEEERGEKVELNNNADIAENYDIIANVPKQEETPKREPSPEPVRAPTPEPVRTRTPEPVRAPTPEPVRAPTPEPVRAPTPEPIRAPTPEPEVKATTEEKHEPASPTSPTKEEVTVGGIRFAGSAQEARARMSKKRRDEVKQQQLSSKDKYNLYMKM